MDIVNESVVLTHKQAELLVYGNEIRGHLVFKPVAGGNIIARITEDIDVQAFSLGDSGGYARAIVVKSAPMWPRRR